jgi:hypothetical protein
MYANGKPPPRRAENVITSRPSWEGPRMIDDTAFGFLLIVGMVIIFLGGLVWHTLNARQRGGPDR